MPAGDMEGLLNFLQEPVFVLNSSGAVLQANMAAKRLLGVDPVGRDLAELISSPGDDFHIYLRRCSGTAAPLVGSLSVCKPDGASVKLRTYGARLAGSAEPVRVALRCIPLHADEFSVLARKVQELNAEIHERRRVQATLEETLRGNQVLLRELHHRVKNNIQMMVGLFSAAQRETSSQELKSFLAGAIQRLLAIGTAQQVMYQSQEMQAVPAKLFIQALCEVIGATLGPTVRLEVSASEGELSNEVAFPLALILNELLTNAFKHGLREESGTIRVTLQRDGEEFSLVVHDDGPGIASGGPERRSSGLGLVQGLCRQIGGAFQVENVYGARCTIRFSDHGHRRDVP
jgi:two-component sensor histidine kinase